MKSTKQLALFLMIGTVLSSCGKPHRTNEEGEELKPFRGSASYRAQCPLYPTMADPRPVALELWDCPIGVDLVEMTRPPRALVFEANCKDMLLKVRSTDRQINEVWAPMPNGVFSMSFDGGSIGLKDDGTGAGECVTSTLAEIRGRVNCDSGDPDRARLEIEALWWMGKKVENSGVAEAGAGRGARARKCQLPANRKCYLYTQSVISQCQ